MFFVNRACKNGVHAPCPKRPPCLKVELVTALSDLLNEANRLNLSSRQIEAEARKRGHSLSFSLVARYLSGKHPENPNINTLQAFADVLHIDVNRLMAASGKEGEVGDPMRLPAESAMLTSSQRTLVEQLVREFAKSNIQASKHLQEEDDHEEEHPALKFAARRNPTGRFDTDGTGSDISS